MRREYVKWYSPSLGREMELLAYRGARLPGGGVSHFGRPIL